MLASYSHEGLRGRGAKGETGPCPGHDPLASPTTVVGVLSEEGFGVGMEKMHSSADRRGPLAAAAAKLISAWVGSAQLTRGANVAATAGGADGCAGMSGLLGRLAGPRARALRLAGRRGPSRSSPQGLLLPFSFSVLHFFSIV